MNHEISLRPVKSGDEGFLLRVYASTRAEEMQLTGWTPEQVDAFLKFQFEAQDKHYKEYYSNSQFDLILIDGQPGGRLYVDRRDDELRIVDIALLHEFRRGGIGTHLLKQLQNEAKTAGKVVRIHVEQNNPALGLYEKLGFVKKDTHGVYLLMEWRPNS